MEVSQSWGMLTEHYVFPVLPRPMDEQGTQSFALYCPVIAQLSESSKHCKPSLVFYLQPSQAAGFFELMLFSVFDFG